MVRSGKKTIKGFVRKPVVFVLAVLVVAAASFFTFRFYFVTERSHPEHPATSTPRQTAELTGEKVVVLTNPPHVRSAEALAEWFHEETGAVVQNVVVNYEEMLDYTLKDVASAAPQLDVIMLWYAELGRLVEQGALIDLTDFIEKNREVLRPEDFIPSLYDPYTLCQGKRWAVPFDGDTHVLFYRKSLLEKHNLSPPETWDDYLNVARTITEKERNNGIYGTAIMAFHAPMIILSGYVNRLGSYGGRLLDEDGHPVVNSPEAIEALSAMVEHAKYALPTPLETDFDVSRDAFLSGRVAMVEQWTDVGVMAQDPTQSLIRDDWGVVQIPRANTPKGRHIPALNSGFSLAVSARAPNPRAAHAFLLFASRPDIALRLNLINGGIDPTRISTLKSQEYRNFTPKVSEAVQAALEGATAWPTVSQTPELLNELTGNVVMALEGRKSPRQALDDTQARWLEILER